MFLIICKFFILLNKKKISKNCQKFFFSYFQKYQIIFHKLKIDFFLIFYNIFMYILGIIIFFYKIYRYGKIYQVDFGLFGIDGN